MERMRTWTFALAFVWVVAGEGLAADWDARVFRDDATLEFKTVSPAGDEHWSTMWLVVIDGEVYVNLGTRAAERLRTNTRTRRPRK
jgi:hypothetical protein